MRSRPRDTDDEVVDLVFERLRAMSPTERFAMADRLCGQATAMAIAGIRHGRPDISDDDLRHELTRRRYGAELADAAFGARPT